jgi:hypothetical protein
MVTNSPGEQVQDLIRRNTVRAGAEFSGRLKAELTQAFAAPDFACVVLSVDDVLMRNAAGPSG